MTTIGSFCNGDGEQQKNKSSRLAKKNVFARASSFFVHFLAVVAQPRHETSELHALAGVGEHKNKNFVIPFPNLQCTYGPFGFNPENFAII